MAYLIFYLALSGITWAGVGLLQNVFVVQMVFQEIGESRKRTVGERVVIYGVHNLVRSNFEFFMKSLSLIHISFRRLLPISLR